VLYFALDYFALQYTTLRLGAEDRGENQKRRGMSLQTDSRSMVPDQEIADVESADMA
jgi:hypothetical protein